MAEVLGVVSSIIGIIQLTSQVAIVGWGYIAAVKGASKSIHDLIGELTSLSKVLQFVQDHANDLGQGATLEMLSDLLQKCETELKEIHSKLELRGGCKGILDSLKWPLKESEMSHHISRIERHKSLFNFVLGADNA